ncbi:serine--tRNA ligase [Candidatus Saccharibacteria bacterium]|nr:serine--tRNA ligase [Candidatus Saccharibacteria bacterium]NCS83078.1 serine--tRNA ligase [Candidatus Saccharibacteria bacterium]
MLDIRFIRENAEAIQKNAQHKGYDVDITTLIARDDERRDLSQKVDQLREKRNANAAQMKGGRPDDAVIEEGRRLKAELSTFEAELTALDNEVTELHKMVPNMASSDVPLGVSEAENVVIKEVGDIPTFDFAPRNHYEIAEQHDWIDKERAAKVAGSRFAYLKGEIVQLQFAIIQYVLTTLSDKATIEKIATEAGLADISLTPFTPILPPYMIRTYIYDAMDRLEPRDDRYKLEDDDLWLQGSAEHVIGSMHAQEIFDEPALPLRYVGYATSFRREAGTYGKDMEGILRMHQFDKLEMESFSTAKDGMNEHLLMVAIQEYLLASLGVPYRMIQKCTADIGKPNARGVDMEAWLPGQNRYRETHTADYMTDYQARRLQTKVRLDSGELEYVHTNDATAFALGRIMIAIIENNQHEDGTVTIPETLRPYIGGRTTLVSHPR